MPFKHGTVKVGAIRDTDDKVFVIITDGGILFQIDPAGAPALQEAGEIRAYWNDAINGPGLRLANNDDGALITLDSDDSIYIKPGAGDLWVDADTGDIILDGDDLVTIDGDDGATLRSTLGDVDIEATAGDINLDTPGTNKHVYVPQLWRPYMRAYMSSSSQLITNNNLTRADIDTILESTNHIGSLSTGGILTISSTDGPQLYRIHAHVAWASNSSGYRRANIEVNGSNMRTVTQPPASGAGTQQDVILDWILDDNDTVEVNVLQNSGGNLNINGGSFDGFETTLTVIRLGADGP